MKSLDQLYTEACNKYNQDVENFNKAYFAIPKELRENLFPVVNDMLVSFGKVKSLGQALNYPLPTATAKRNVRTGGIHFQCPGCGNEEEIHELGIFQCPRCARFYEVNKTENFYAGRPAGVAFEDQPW